MANQDLEKLSAPQVQAQPHLRAVTTHKLNIQVTGWLPGPTFLLAKAGLRAAGAEPRQAETSLHPPRAACLCSGELKQKLAPKVSRKPLLRAQELLVYRQSQHITLVRFSGLIKCNECEKGNRVEEAGRWHGPQSHIDLGSNPASEP